MSLICLGMYCLCLWLAVQTVEKVRQISPGVSLRYAQALTGEQVKKAQTYIKSSQNTDGLMVTFWEETQVAVRSPVSTRTCTDVCSIGFCGTAHDAYGASYVVGTAPGSGDTSQCAVSTALAWQLFGSTDILEQALGYRPRRTFRGTVAGLLFVFFWRSHTLTSVRLYALPQRPPCCFCRNHRRWTA